MRKSLAAALASAEARAAPFPHWILRDVLPAEWTHIIAARQVAPPRLDGVSGKRELHNDQRSYFDARAIAAEETVNAIADAFQAAETARLLSAFFSVDLDGTYLRIEHAVDAEGFWLQPHTDLGVKKITILLYISPAAGGDDLGTDLYDADASWAARGPFAPNLALAFRPGADTYHGFEPRAFEGRRQSLIINYVSEDWRDREQLCFPQTPVDC